MKMNASSQMPLSSQRIIFWGAAYDVLVTAGFVTPWTAAIILKTLSQLHVSLGLAGMALPVADATTMLFVNLLGTVVVMWSVIRLYRPTVLNGTADTVGRLLFATWMAFAMYSGATRIIWLLLAGEIIWFFLQSGAIAYAFKYKKPNSAVQ